MKKILILSGFILFVLSNSLSAQIDIKLQASRTSGVAPLFVFFDVTTTTGLVENDYLNANFFWNFGDPTGKHNKAKGFVAAHVFETPGNYSVTVNVVDINGNTAAKTVIINVTEFSGTTYYVANNGNDGGTGTETTPFKTVEKGFSVLGPNTRVLFRRGDTFTTSRHSVHDLTGPVIIGAYGTGNDPVLFCQEENWGIINFNERTDDVRFMDIKILGTTSDRNASVAQRALVASDQSSNILFLRCEVENIARDASQLYGSNNAVFDCYFHDFASYSCYTVGDNLAFVGNVSRRQTGNEHFYRTQGGSKQFIAFNDYDEITDAKSSIQIRGDGTNNVVVLGNRVHKSMGFHPQNSEQEEYVSNCLAEDNISADGISVTSKNIIIRNNLLGHGIKLNTHPLVGISDNVHIYNNTIYGDLTLAISGIGTGIKFKNNCYFTPTTLKYAAVISFPDIDPAEVEIDNNIYYGPNKESNTELWFHLAGNTYKTFSEWQETGFDANSLVTDPQFVSTNFNEINYLRPTGDSPLLNKGAEVPVFSDYEGNLRFYGEPINVGAYQSIITGIDNIVREVNSSNMLENYPNPFSGSTTISFTAPASGYYSLKIFDINGRLVMDLLDKTIPKGRQSIEWNGTNSYGQKLNSGIFIYQLASKNEILQTNKLILTK